MTKIAALAGGVGGAKMAHGLMRALSPGELTVIVNTGDDFDYLGLPISPDLDTVCYTLAGLANPQTGWGRAQETWHAYQEVRRLGGPGWFRLGDHDLGIHLERGRRLKEGDPLSEITRDFCRVWNIPASVLPMSDQPTPTYVHTEEGVLAFQEYFVHRECKPIVTGFHFEGIKEALPAPGVLEAIHEADMVVICPSNPWVSVEPILSLPGLRGALREKTVLAVSPIIAGSAVKGPAAKMYRELGITPSAFAVAEYYGSLLTGIVIDRKDEKDASRIARLDMDVFITDIFMKSNEDRARLAREILEYGESLK